MQIAEKKLETKNAFNSEELHCIFKFQYLIYHIK